jgi:glycosyltransferase involved in cell wall biosynthesis
MAKNIIFFTAHYTPESNFITEDLAVGLLDNGYRVIVITTYPNYPGGKFFPGYFHFYPKMEKNKGIIIVRLPHFPDHSKSSLVRLISYMSFVIGAFFTGLIVSVLFFPARILVYQTPFFMALAAIPFRLFRVPLIYICADLWPESLIATSTAKNSTIIKILFRYSRWINKFATTLIVSTNGMKERYIKDGILQRKVHFIPVWVDGIPQILEPPLKHRKYLNRIVYAGNLGLAQGLDVFIKAFKTKEIKDSGLELCFIGIGNDLSRLQMLAADETNISFIGRLNPQESFDYMRNARGVIAHLVATPQFEMTLPSKLASCLASGTPFLCGVNGETNTMLKPYSSVLLFNSEDCDGIVSHLRTLIVLSEEEINRIGNDNQDIYRTYFDKVINLHKYIQLIESIKE